MLILSRKKGQKLIINDNIEVVIIEADSGVAKIGIKAPKDVTIYREELYNELKQTNKNSIDTEVDTLKQLEEAIKNMPQGNVNIKKFGLPIKKHEEE